MSRPPGLIQKLGVGLLALAAFIAMVTFGGRQAHAADTTDTSITDFGDGKGTPRQHIAYGQLRFTVQVHCERGGTPTKGHVLIDLYHYDFTNGRGALIFEDRVDGPLRDNHEGRGVIDLDLLGLPDGHNVGPGEYQIVAKFVSEDGNYDGSETDHVANQFAIDANPATANGWHLSYDPPNPEQYQTVTFHADWIGGYGSGKPPTGTVQFQWGGSSTPIGPAQAVMVDQSGLHATASALFTAKQNLTDVFARYTGDDLYKGGNTSPKITVPIAEIKTATSLVADRTSADVTGSFHLTSNVSLVSSGSQVPPVGYVVFTIAGTTTLLGRADLGLNGQALVVIAASNPDLDRTKPTPVVACYYSSNKPDPIGYSCSTTPIQLTVGLAATTTTLTVSPGTASLDDSVTYRATVSGGAVAPTGWVAFQVDGDDGGSGELKGGVATVSTGDLKAGMHEVVAIYQGDALHQATNSSPAGVTVAKAATTTTLATPQADVAPQTAVEYTATVAGSKDSPSAGHVEFSVAGKVARTVSMTNGVARYQAISAATPGKQEVTAKYVGDDRYLASTSKALTQQVTVPPAPASSSPTTHVTRSGVAAPKRPDVPAAPDVAEHGPLASTGARVAQLTIGSIALLLAGVALSLLGVSRRRSRHRT
jgi:hypothetical protein